MNLTVTHKGIVRKIISKAAVVSFGSGRSENVTALWDTGAARSMISGDIAKKLKLDNAGLTQIKHVTGIETLPVCSADIEIQGGLKIIEHRLIAMPNIHAFDMIIGMDIISRGRFCIENRNGKTVFTFRC